MFKNMQWMNEPPEWSIRGGSLFVKTGDKTDFWRETFYQFIRDDGHFIYREVEGDFTAEVVLAGKYEVLYDQMGLMLRVDEKNWIKTGIEFTDGLSHLSTVITRDYSDWSVIKMDRHCENVAIRLTRHDSALRVQYLDEGGRWQLLRLGYLDMPPLCQVGLVCCSPQRSGFEAEFRDFVIKEAISRKLHD